MTTGKTGRGLEAQVGYGEWSKWEGTHGDVEGKREKRSIFVEGNSLHQDPHEWKEVIVCGRREGCICEGRTVRVGCFCK